MNTDELTAARRSSLCRCGIRCSTGRRKPTRIRSLSITPGVEFFTVDGKYLDFNSQLWSVNIGHADPRVVEAIRAQAERLPYISPIHTTEVRVPSFSMLRRYHTPPGRWRGKLDCARPNIRPPGEYLSRTATTR